MAVTQYIGARYVPLFADPIEWSNGYEYEALTIVLHEGNSYTSVKAVPKGIDITNETYWAETGNYNAQIEAYRKEVATLSGTVEKITPEINEPTELDKDNQKLFVNNEYDGSGFANVISSRDDKLESIVLPGVHNYGLMGGSIDICEAISVAGTWLIHREDLFYSADHTAIEYEGTYDNPVAIDPHDYPYSTTDARMPIDCNTFTLLASCGVTYGNSRYSASGAKNTPMHPFLNPTSDAVKPYWRSTYSNSYDETSVGKGQLRSDTLARYLYDCGMLEFLDPEDHTACQPGDIIFTGRSSQTDRWMGIGHCLMLAGGIGPDIDNMITVECVSGDTDGMTTRGMTRLNGDIVAKYTPNWTGGARLAWQSHASGALITHNICHWNYDLRGDGLTWDCASGKIGDYANYSEIASARVVTITSVGTAVNNLTITLTRKYSDLSENIQTRKLTRMRGNFQFFVPMGWDINMACPEDAEENYSANISLQLCTSDRQICVLPKTLS